MFITNLYGLQVNVQHKIESYQKEAEVARTQVLAHTPKPRTATQSLTSIIRQAFQLAA